MILATLALFQTAWLFVPANDDVMEVRAFSGFAQAPELMARRNISVRRAQFGIATELSVYQQTYLAVKVPFIWARGIDSSTTFYDRQDLGDLEVRVRYRLWDRASIDVGALMPGATDEETLEDNFPTTQAAFPPLGSTAMKIELRGLTTHSVGPWQFGIRAGVLGPATRFEPALTADLIGLWSTAQGGFSAGPYFDGQWSLEGPDQQRGVLGLMERIGMVRGVSLELKLETTVFSTNMEKQSAIHVAAVWRK
ncbi:MAG: hypothetical protein VX589_11270 [Myxococcota bacterium]|nr:hypothetical protein [Myxococcota bacterium]